MPSRCVEAVKGSTSAFMSNHSLPGKPLSRAWPLLPSASSSDQPTDRKTDDLCSGRQPRPPADLATLSLILTVVGGSSYVILHLPA